MSCPRGSCPTFLLGTTGSFLVREVATYNSEDRLEEAQQGEPEVGTEGVVAGGTARSTAVGGGGLQQGSSSNFASSSSSRRSELGEKPEVELGVAPGASEGDIDSVKARGPLASEGTRDRIQELREDVYSGVYSIDARADSDSLSVATSSFIEAEDYSADETTSSAAPSSGPGKNVGSVSRSRASTIRTDDVEEDHEDIRTETSTFLENNQPSGRTTPSWAELKSSLEGLEGTDVTDVSSPTASRSRGAGAPGAASTTSSSSSQSSAKSSLRSPSSAAHPHLRGATKHYNAVEDHHDDESIGYENNENDVDGISTGSSHGSAASTSSFTEREGEEEAAESGRTGSDSARSSSRSSGRVSTRKSSRSSAETTTTAIGNAQNGLQNFMKDIQATTLERIMKQDGDPEAQARIDSLQKTLQPVAASLIALRRGTSGDTGAQSNGLTSVLATGVRNQFLSGRFMPTPQRDTHVHVVFDKSPANMDAVQPVFVDPANPGQLQIGDVPDNKNVNLPTEIQLQEGIITHTNLPQPEPSLPNQQVSAVYALVSFGDGFKVTAWNAKSGKPEQTNLFKIHSNYLSVFPKLNDFVTNTDVLVTENGKQSYQPGTIFLVRKVERLTSTGTTSKTVGRKQITWSLLPLPDMTEALDQSGRDVGPKWTSPALESDFAVICKSAKQLRVLGNPVEYHLQYKDAPQSSAQQQPVLDVRVFSKTELDKTFANKGNELQFATRNLLPTPYTLRWKTNMSATTIWQAALQENRAVDLRKMLQSAGGFSNLFQLELDRDLLQKMQAAFLNGVVPTVVAWVKKNLVIAGGGKDMSKEEKEKESEVLAGVAGEYLKRQLRTFFPMFLPDGTQPQVIKPVSAQDRLAVYPLQHTFALAPRAKSAGMKNLVATVAGVISNAGHVAGSKNKKAQAQQNKEMSNGLRMFFNLMDMEHTNPIDVLVPLVLQAFEFMGKMNQPKKTDATSSFVEQELVMGEGRHRVDEEDAGFVLNGANADATNSTLDFSVQHQGEFGAERTAGAGGSPLSEHATIAEATSVLLQELEVARRDDEDRSQTMDTSGSLEGASRVVAAGGSSTEDAKWRSSSSSTTGEQEDYSTTTTSLAQLGQTTTQQAAVPVQLQTGTAGKSFLLNKTAAALQKFIANLLQLLQAMLQTYAKDGGQLYDILKDDQKRLKQPPNRGMTAGVSRAEVVENLQQTSEAVDSARKVIEDKWGAGRPATSGQVPKQPPAQVKMEKFVAPTKTKTSGGKGMEKTKGGGFFSGLASRLTGSTARAAKNGAAAASYSSFLQRQQNRRKLVEIMRQGNYAKQGQGEELGEEVSDNRRGRKKKKGSRKPRRRREDQDEWDRMDPSDEDDYYGRGDSQNYDAAGAVVRQDLQSGNNECCNWDCGCDTMFLGRKYAKTSKYCFIFFVAAFITLFMFSLIIFFGGADFFTNCDLWVLTDIGAGLASHGEGGGGCLSLFLAGLAACTICTCLNPRDEGFEACGRRCGGSAEGSEVDAVDTCKAKTCGCGPCNCYLLCCCGICRNILMGREWNNIKGEGSVRYNQQEKAVSVHEHVLQTKQGQKMAEAAKEAVHREHDE
ncbi:unnamed protein product [Amoebophrya sp. A120]|nr:unnamed protein product [Amoebophrya sp. A120]|eukprot:GSA120T00009138001.1